MMVNQIKNTDASWQSTIPQQMPWMSSYEPTSFNMQFGQQPLSGIGSNIIVNPTDPHLLMQQQHPSMANFPTATTLTLPVTVCPTTFAANSLLSSSLNAPQIGVTTTTQSYPLILNSGLSTNLDHTLLNQNVSQTIDRVSQSFSPINSLTHMSSNSSPSTESYHKRSSIEMEDDQIKALEPPTKQLLSESKLFKRFGSLHLDGAGVEDSTVNNPDSDESEDEQPDSLSINDKTHSREEFNRYVYLLFKDKKGEDMSFAPTNNTLDRLAREERDKLNKAVVLWNPRNKFFEPADEDDDEEEDGELKYSDHTDFLKKPHVDTITISEVISDSNNDAVIAEEPLLLDSDDVMLE